MILVTLWRATPHRKYEPVDSRQLPLDPGDVDGKELASLVTNMLRPHEASPSRVGLSLRDVNLTGPEVFLRRQGTGQAFVLRIEPA